MHMASTAFTPDERHQVYAMLVISNRAQTFPGFFGPVSNTVLTYQTMLKLVTYRKILAPIVVQIHP